MYKAAGIAAGMVTAILAGCQNQGVEVYRDNFGLNLQVREDDEIAKAVIRDLDTGEKFDITSNLTGPDSMRDEPFGPGYSAQGTGKGKFHLAYPFGGKLDESHRFGAYVTDRKGETIRGQEANGNRMHRVQHRGGN